VRPKLFLAASILAAALAVVGSMAGHLVSTTGIFVGGLLGGTLGVALAVALARWRAWVTRPGAVTTGVGGLIGFYTAAALTVTHLSSPVVPILSTALIGLGAVLGNALSTRRRPADGV
jgi:hypothetical protein